MISLIASVDKNGGIGAGGRPLWTQGMAADTQRFRELTAGNTVVMGRKAYESFHGKLPGRQNIVVTHKFLVDEDVVFVRGLEEAYEAATGSEIDVIGGASIFAQAMDSADRIYLTQVEAEYQGVDAYFPQIDRLQWREARREQFPADERNVYGYSFIVYERIK